MTHYTPYLLALQLMVASTAMAQADRSISYGSQGFAIPGSSAVAYSAPATPQAATLQPAFATSKVEPRSQAVAARAEEKAERQAVARADTTLSASADPAPVPAMGWGYPAAPYRYDYYGGLHTGLNVSLSMSVFAQFGKHARRGAGFTQRIDATYLQPLGRKTWLAVGGYAEHTNWGGDSYTSGGLYGELGYQFDDHWAAYIYGRKSLVNDGLQGYGYPLGYGYYGMDVLGMPGYDIGDKLGAAVRWTPNEKFSMQLSVEKNWYPRVGHGYPDRYKYNYPQESTGR